MFWRGVKWKYIKYIQLYCINNSNQKANVLFSDKGFHDIIFNIGSL